MFAALGARVTVALRYERMLRSFDEMLSRRLMTAMRRTASRWSARRAGVGRKCADGHRIALADGRSLGPFDCIVWAIGRRPNTAGLGLAEAGVKIGAVGEVVTDDPAGHRGCRASTRSAT